MNIRMSITLLTLCSSAGFAQVVAPQATDPQEAQLAPQTAVQHPLDEARAARQRLETDSPVVFNGGIGLQERASAPKEGTKLEFFIEGGAFVSGVQVLVTDMMGRQIVDAVTEGPWLILDLAEGEYDVHASFEGHTESSRITVDSRVETIGYMFPPGDPGERPN